MRYRTKQRVAQFRSSASTRRLSAMADMLTRSNAAADNAPNVSTMSFSSGFRMRGNSTGRCPAPRIRRMSRAAERNIRWTTASYSCRGPLAGFVIDPADHHFFLHTGLHSLLLASSRSPCGIGKKIIAFRPTPVPSDARSPAPAHHALVHSPFWDMVRALPYCVPLRRKNRLCACRFEVCNEAKKPVTSNNPSVTTSL